MIYVFRLYVLRLLDRSLYVGHTAHTREHRARQHMEGGRLAARVCRRVGVKCLARSLCPKQVYDTRPEAERAEVLLAKALRKRFPGITVHQH